MSVSLMYWLASSERDTLTDTLEKCLWAAAEQAVAAPKSGLKSQEYSAPVHGIEGAICQAGQTNNPHHFPST